MITASRAVYAPADRWLGGAALDGGWRPGGQVLQRRARPAATAGLSRLARRLVAGPHRDGGQGQFIEQPVPDTSSQPPGPVLAWALQHLADTPTPDLLATMAAMSRRSFYRAFRAETGTTPHRWLLAQQVVLAQRLLETTPLGVAEIARRSGFDDVSVFRRHFTARTGLSPRSYRRVFGQLGA